MACSLGEKRATYPIGVHAAIARRGSCHLRVSVQAGSEEGRGQREPHFLDAPMVCWRSRCHVHHVKPCVRHLRRRTACIAPADHLQHCTHRFFSGDFHGRAHHLAVTTLRCTTQQGSLLRSDQFAMRHTTTLTAEPSAPCSVARCRRLLAVWGLSSTN